MVITTLNNIGFLFSIGFFLSKHPCENMLMSVSKRPVLCISISQLDDLPCNIQGPVQPVNQPEVEVANESAGRLLLFSDCKFLSRFLFFFIFSYFCPKRFLYT